MLFLSYVCMFSTLCDEFKFWSKLNPVFDKMRLTKSVFPYSENKFPVSVLYIYIDTFWLSYPKEVYL